jgi:hypothetical protein
LVLLNESTIRLNESAAQQLKAARDLEKSSLRLEVLSGAVLLLSAVLAVTAGSSYFLQAFTTAGFSGPQAQAWTFVGTLTLVGAIAMGLALLLRQARRRRKDLTQVP